MKVGREKLQLTKEGEKRKKKGHPVQLMKVNCHTSMRNEVYIYITSVSDFAGGG